MLSHLVERLHDLMMFLVEKHAGQTAVMVNPFDSAIKQENINIFHDKNPLIFLLLKLIKKI
jgi:hypothetical protein